MFGAGIFAEFQFLQKLADALGGDQRAEIVGQRFALLGETGFDEFEKRRGIADVQVRVFTRKMQGDERRADFRGRPEGAAGKAQGEVRASVKLRNDGKVAVLLTAGAGREACGDFELNDDVDLVDLTGELEKMVEDRGSNVVGEIAVDAHAAPGGKGGKVRLEDVAGNDGEIGMFLREALQADNERGIEFDGDHRSTAAKEMLGHFAVPGADFDPAELFGRDLRDGLDAVRRDADGAGDFFAPAGVVEKVLTEPLSRHGVGSYLLNRLLKNTGKVFFRG